MRIITRPKFRIQVLVALLSAIICAPANALPGDTTWVTVYNLRKITQYGNMDTVAVFPKGKRYRKIRMHYILGRYACPGSPQYCGSWDYTTEIYARPKNMDSVEIGRVITPYATDWLTQNKKHDYVLDVTDYASALQDTVAMRFRYEGYSWGFTITLKLEFIEGVPPMDALAVKNIYNGYFAYGNAADPIENHLKAKTHVYPSTVTRAYVKNIVSGHGADATGCSEFCNKYYNLKIDNALVSQTQLWRADCGSNHVYPQTGTWVFNRGNWCPGAIVNPIYHYISPYTMADGPFDVDIDMQPYTINNPSGGYNFVSQLVTYGPENFTTDVSLEDIISPTFNENYARNNSACMNPRVRVKNTGYDSVYTVAFEYGIRGLTPLTYTWTGSIGFLQETEIVFPASTPVMSQSVSLPFDVKITSVNSLTGDENQLNNKYTSQTTPVAVLPREFVVKTITNGSSAGFSGKNQTSWVLTNEKDSVIAARTNLNNNSSFRDSIYALPDGCYKLSVEDSGCDGFNWWYYQYYNPNPGNGSLRISPPGLNSSLFVFPGDIGCGFTKYFRVGQSPAMPPPPVDYTGITEKHHELISFEVYPNPASEQAFLQLDLLKTQDVSYTIFDINGRQCLTRKLSGVSVIVEQFSTAGLNSGFYLVAVQLSDGSTVTKKLLVHKP